MITKEKKEQNSPLIFSALRESLKEGYRLSDLKSDILSGSVVALIAIPLGMALAIASGVPPQYGLYTVIIAGIVVSLLGGSRFQVTGPTAAFVVILAPIVHDHGLAGLLIAGLMSGLILMAMGASGLGRLIQFIPYPVTTGFTTGIAVVIGVLQLKDFLGLRLMNLPDSFSEKVHTLFVSIDQFSVSELSIGVVSLAGLFVWSRWTKKIPAPIVILSFVSLFIFFLQKFFPAFQAETIGTRFEYFIDGVKFSGIPGILPNFEWPWLRASSDVGLSWSLIQELIPSAFAIALLGAIESLLSAVVADGMTQKKHNPNAELFALGVGNLICPFFGGIPATGAIARTATNIRYGAKSPISCAIHGVVTLLVILFFAPFVSYLPLAALAALLIFVAYSMSEYKHFFHIIRVAPKSDVAVLLICFGLTVLFDMVVGVGVGVVLASLLFIQRMSELTKTSLLSESKPSRFDVPEYQNYIVYEIAGPLFFGAAERAVRTVSDFNDKTEGIIFLMEKVPLMDVTGLVALESSVRKVLSRGKKVILFGVQSQPRELLMGSEVFQDSERIHIL